MLSVVNFFASLAWNLQFGLHLAVALHFLDKADYDFGILLFYAHCSKRMEKKPNFFRVIF